MQFGSDFKSLSFDPFSLQQNVSNNKSDPDVNFYGNNVSNVEANYFLMTEDESSLTSYLSNPYAFAILHLNIRSMTTNFENIKDFLKNLSVNFTAICLSETWCSGRITKQYKRNVIYKPLHKFKHKTLRTTVTAKPFESMSKIVNISIDTTLD